MPDTSLERRLNLDLSYLKVARGFKSEQGGELMQRAPEQFRRRMLVPKDRDFGFDKRVIDDGASRQTRFAHIGRKYTIHPGRTEYSRHRRANAAAKAC